MAWRLFLLTIFLLQGCSDPLEKLVNSNFPPIDASKQRQTTIDTNADALSRLGTPNVALTVMFSDLKQVLVDSSLKKDGVIGLEIDGDEGLLRVKVAFDRKFGESDAPDDPELAKRLGELKPHIVGEVIFLAGITGGVTQFGNAAPELELKLLPSLSSIQVKKITISEKYYMTLAGVMLTSVLNRFRDNISGVLSRKPVTSVDIPALSNESLNVAGPVKSDNPNITINLSAKPVVAPFKLDGFAWLIKDNRLIAVMQISPTELPAATNSITVEHTYDGIEKRIDEIVEQVMDVPDPESKTWVAIKKDVIAHAMNSLLEQTSACVTVSAELPNQHSENKIAMPNGAGVNCDITRSCDSNRVCEFNANQDNRDCSACILRAPRICGPWNMGCVGGQCTVMGQDPICQAAKIAQQGFYNLDANARKADCDRLRETERLVCQAEVAGEHALCQAKRTALDALGKTGNFANLDVDVSVKTKDMEVCFNNFVMSPALEDLRFSLSVIGAADAHVYLRFMPLDAGHLVCPVKWQKTLDLRAEISDGQIGVASHVALRNEKVGLAADFSLDKINLKARMKPSPTEFLLKSPDLLIKCPVMQFVAPVVVMLTPFVPELRGDFDLSIPAQKVSAGIPSYEQRVSGRPLALTTSTTPAAILISGQVSPETKVVETADK